MPNYIKNRIELIGTKIQIDEMLERFSTHFERDPDRSYDGNLIFLKTGEEYGVGWLNETTGEFEERGKPKVQGVPNNWEQRFNEAWTRFPDFNKILPMPATLNISIHSGVENAVKNALKMDVHKNSLIGSLEAANREKTESPLKLNDADWELFLTCLNNVRLYGFIYWYDWAIINWGTKWNSSDCEKVNETTFDFTTAWSGVSNLINIMSKEFPKIQFNYEYSDEDTGSNCGIGKYQNGEIELRNLKDGSKEAYELYFKLRPDDLKNYQLVGDTYEYIEEE